MGQEELEPHLLQLADCDDRGRGRSCLRGSIAPLAVRRQQRKLAGAQRLPGRPGRARGPPVWRATAGQRRDGCRVTAEQRL